MSRLSYFTGALLAVFALVNVANATTYEFTPNPTDLNNLNHGYYYTWGINTGAIGTDQRIVSMTLTFDNIANHGDGAYDLYVHLFDNVGTGGTKIGASAYQYSDAANTRMHDNFGDPSWAGQTGILLSQWSRWFELDSGSFDRLAAQKVPSAVLDRLHALKDVSYTTSTGSTPEDAFLNQVKAYLSATDYNKYKNKILEAATQQGGGNLIPAQTPRNVEYQFTASQIATALGYMSDNRFSLGFDPDGDLDSYLQNKGIKLTVETAPVPVPGTLLLLGSGIAAFTVCTRMRKK